MGYKGWTGLSPAEAKSKSCVEHAPLWALWFLFSINYFRKKEEENVAESPKKVSHWLLDSAITGRR